MLLGEINKIRVLFSKKDKIQYVGLLALMFFGSFLDVIGIGAIPIFVATLAAPAQLEAFPVVGNLIKALDITPGADLVVFGSMILMALFLFRNVFLYFIKYLQTLITERHRVRLTDQLFQAYLRAPWETHLSRDSATILRNVNMETAEIVTGIVNPLLTLLMNGMMAFLVVILLISTTPMVAVAGVLFIGITIASFLLVTRKWVEEFGEHARDERKNMVKSVNQALSLMPELKVLGKETFFQETVHQSISKFARATRLRQAINFASTPFLEVVAVIGLLGIVIVLISTGAEPKSLIPALALYAAAIVRLRQYVGTIATNINQIQFSKASIPSVVDELEILKQQTLTTAPKVKNAQLPANSKLTLNDAITVTNLTYSYPETNAPALHRLNLKIEKGESIGFVGGTGSGKTTFANLILGLLQQQEGHILVDGVDIQRNIRSWQNHIGYIPQTIVLLDDTIRRNIAFGLADDQIEDKQVLTVVEAAQLQDFICELPEGLDTVVGERGVRLSGGQRQRVGIARALYTNPDVIIMDEATAALDNQTEELLMSALHRFKENRTFIMIAHRLSTIRNCDRLYFMQQGRVEAVGTYDELIEAHSSFRAMAAAS